MAERLGVLGGTFDPIHTGHVLLARSVLERLPLDRVLFVPAATPPHKDRADVASAAHRLEMVKLAIARLKGFEACSLELDRQGPSYTVDTLRQLRALHPGSELFLLVGADNVGDMATWHDPQGILELATVVAGARGPSAAAASLDASASVVAALSARILRVDTPVFEISSTEVRRRLRQGLPIRYLVPEGVERYLRAHRLYLLP